MTDNAPVFKLIHVNHIVPSRHQARRSFNEESISALATSIRNEGLLEPIVVRLVPAPSHLPAGATPDGEWYELVYGERRWRACRLLGWDMMEAKIISVASEAAASAKGLVENLQREGINPIEEAEGFAHLNQLDPGYWTHEKISEVTGRSRVYITQSLGVMQMPDAIKNNVSRLTLSRSHALELMRLPSDDLKIKAANEIITRDLNRESTRQLIDKMIENTNNNANSKQEGREVADKVGAKADTSGFRIGKSGRNMLITGRFPLTAAVPDMAAALQDAVQKWQAKSQGKAGSKAQ